MFHACLYYTVMLVPYSLVITCWERADLLVLLREMFPCVVVTSPCYDIKLVRKEEGKSYWKIPLCDDDATREK